MNKQGVLLEQENVNLAKNTAKDTSACKSSAVIKEEINLPDLILCENGEVQNFQVKTESFPISKEEPEPCGGDLHEPFYNENLNGHESDVKPTFDIKTKSHDNSEGTLLDGAQEEGAVFGQLGSTLRPCFVVLPRCDSLINKDVKNRLVRQVKNQPIKPGEKTFKCQQKSTVKADLLAHGRNYHRSTRASKKDVDWNNCKKSSLGKSTPKRKKSYKCKICDKSFSCNYYFQRHNTIHTNEKPFTCNECQKSYKRKCSLIRHQRIHTGEKPNKRTISGKPADALNRRGRTRVASEFNFNCGHCEKSFSNKGYILRHIKIHLGIKAYKCEICDKSFSLCNGLKRHLRIHSGEKPYMCDICKKSFARRCALVIHFKQHSERETYKCSYCQKEINTERSLIQHYRIHTGEKPYKCEICERVFSSTASFSHHRKSHTMNGDFNCDHCLKSFTGKITLRAHIMKKHLQIKLYKCNVCQKELSTKKSLIEHQRVHTGEKPYKCTKCDKAYGTSTSLYRHQRSHDQSRYFHCDNCRESFSKKSNLVVHMMKKHL